jgi:hypothetical protein
MFTATASAAAVMAAAAPGPLSSADLNICFSLYSKVPLKQKGLEVTAVMAKDFL